MNIRALLLACLAMLTACAAAPPTAAPSALSAQPEQQAANRVLIVLYDPAVGAEPLLQAMREMQAELVYRYTNINGIAAHIPPQQDMAQAMRRLERVPGVLQVQRDQIMQLQTLPRIEPAYGSPIFQVASVLPVIPNQPKGKPNHDHTAQPPQR